MTTEHILEQLFEILEVEENADILERAKMVMEVYKHTRY